MRGQERVNASAGRRATLLRARRCFTNEPRYLIRLSVFDHASVYCEPTGQFPADAWGFSLLYGTSLWLTGFDYNHLARYADLISTGGVDFDPILDPDSETAEGNDFIHGGRGGDLLTGGAGRRMVLSFGQLLNQEFCFKHLRTAPPNSDTHCPNGKSRARVDPCYPMRMGGIEPKGDRQRDTR